MHGQLEKEIDSRFPDRLTWQKTIPTFHPESTEEAAAVFALASKHKQQLFIAGFSNTIDPIGEPFKDLLVVKSDRLNDIHEINAADLYAVVGAGFPLKELNRHLVNKNLWFPFSDTHIPGSFGGAMASGVCAGDGAHEVPFSRYVIALTAVMPSGEIITPGAKTFKSVAGYDITRMFYNSWGLLGMIISLTVRILPLQQKDILPRLLLKSLDLEGFRSSLAENSPAGKFYRDVRAAYDPDNLLTLV